MIVFKSEHKVCCSSRKNIYAIIHIFQGLLTSQYDTPELFYIFEVMLQKMDCHFAFLTKPIFP